MIFITFVQNITSLTAKHDESTNPHITSATGFHIFRSSPKTKKNTRKHRECGYNAENV